MITPSKQPLAVCSQSKWYNILCKVLEQHHLPLAPYALNTTPTLEQLEGSLALGLAGALLGDPKAHQLTASPLYEIAYEAQQAQRLDTLVCSGDVIVGHWCAGEALRRLLHSAAVGVKALVFGLEDSAWLACMRPLEQVSLYSTQPSQGEAFMGHLPVAQRGLVVSNKDDLAAVARHTDLMIYAGGTLPLEVLQPYHTLLELSPMAASVRKQAVGRVQDCIDHPVLTALTLQQALERLGHSLPAEDFLVQP